MNSHESMTDSCNIESRIGPSVDETCQIDQQQLVNAKKTKSRQHLANDSVKLDSAKASQTKTTTQLVTANRNAS